MYTEPMTTTRSERREKMIRAIARARQNHGGSTVGVVWGAGQAPYVEARALRNAREFDRIRAAAAARNANR